MDVRLNTSNKILLYISACLAILMTIFLILNDIILSVSFGFFSLVIFSEFIKSFVDEKSAERDRRKWEAENQKMKENAIHSYPSKNSIIQKYNLKGIVKKVSEKREDLRGVKKLEYDEQLELIKKQGYVYPTWDVMRDKMREWGVEMAARNCPDLSRYIVREKNLRPKEIESLLRPIVIMAMVRTKNDRRKRLIIDDLFIAIKRLRPNIFQLQLFQKQTMKDDIERDFKHYLGEGSRKVSDLGAISRLFMSRIIFPNDNDDIIDFFLDKLPVPEIKDDITDLRKIEDEWDESTKDSKEFLELKNKMYLIETFYELYNEVNYFLKENGKDHHRQKFKEKLDLYSLYQDEILYED